MPTRGRSEMVRTCLNRSESSSVTGLWVAADVWMGEQYLQLGNLVQVRCVVATIPSIELGTTTRW